MAIFRHKILLALVLVFVLDETWCAMACETQVKKHGCTGNPNAPYYECVIPNIYSIVSIDVHQLATRNSDCKYHAGALPDTWTPDLGGVYGFAGDTIIVAGSCRAVFEVEFDVCVNENAPTCNGTLRRHGCSAMYDGDYHECVVPNTGDIVSISVFNKVSKDADCLFYPPPTINTVWTSGDGGAYSFEENRIIIAGGCRGVFDVCTSDTPSGCEGKTMKHGGCAANANEEYYNCTIPHVYSIIDIDVHQITSSGYDCSFHEGGIPFNWTVDQGGVYGFEGNTIEVAGGCRGVFEVELDYCVNEEPPMCDGEWKRHPCTNHYNTDYNECTVPNVADILYAAIFKKVSIEDCVFYPPPIPTSWTPAVGGAYTFYGNKIVVAGGCRAVFDICASVLKTCDVHGDPHIKTFDEKHFSFGGVCSYYLMQHGNLSIIGENQECFRSHVSCLKSVTILYDGISYKLGQKHNVTVDDVVVSLPFQSSEIEIKKLSQHITVAMLANGMVVTWNGSKAAEIKVPDIFMDLTKGLCGNFDLDPSNDFQTPNGTVVTDHNVFGESWKTDSNCVDFP